jgi:hypothetical protein
MTALIARQKKRKTSLFLNDQEDRMLLSERIYHQRGEVHHGTGSFAIQV